LKESQELYQNCGFISKKTRSIYAWRAALWVRYCKERSLDFAVTEDRLIDYLDWLFDIDLVNKINTKKSYVPDILRDHMGSVICLWRIQTGNNPDLVSPKEGSRYQAKWDEILRNHPRRDRYRPLSFEQKIQLADAGAGPSGPAHSHPGASSSYARDTQYQAQQQPQQQAQPQPFAGRLHPRHHPLPPSQPPQARRHNIQPSPYHRPLDPLAGSRPPAIHAPTSPAGIPEPTELAWQLQWLQDPSWAAGAARMLFTTAMTTWVDAAHIVGLRLGDAYFASSTMAPRLPSSVMRISLATGAEPGPYARSTGPFAAIPAPRQLFSVIRARNPLSCAWNALASILFYRWHVVNAPLPSFADGTWQYDPMLLVDLGGASLLPDMADSGASPFAERQHLVRSLLPQHRLPVERVVRLQSLERARRMASPGSASGSDQGDVRMASGTAPRTLAAAIAPLSDTAPPERLEQLAAANSGYYEDYHCIQRHKIFPWATAMMGMVPAGASVEERSSVSRLQDFLLDLRIVLLQDIAVLKCCAESLPPGFDTSGILCEPVFNSLEFARFCETMQRGAAEELRALRYDLDMAAHQTGGYGVSGHGQPPAYGLPAGAGAAAQGHLVPGMASAHRSDSAMAIGTPHGESFSPIASPSPPLSGAHDMARNPTLFMDIPPHAANVAMKDSPQLALRQEMSHSMPNPPMEGWGDSLFHGAAPPSLTVPSSAIGGSSAHQSAAKRRRPHAPPTPHLASLSAAAMLPLPASPYSAMSPRSYWRSTHTHRTARSPPRPSHSPRTGSLSASGDRPGHMVLPSISHITHAGSSGASPMQPALPFQFGRGPGQQQQQPHQQQHHQHHQRQLSGFLRRDADPLQPLGAPRRDSDSTVDNSSGGMVTGRDEPSGNEIEMIAALRRENESLRERMQRLEITVAQKQEEIQSWMSRIEKQLMRASDM
ncbi:hypothetical protein H4R19_001092, partial [Coemansia spiralis]